MIRSIVPAAILIAGTSAAFGQSTSPTSQDTLRSGSTTTTSSTDVFKDLDTNKDGKLSMTEYRNMHSASGQSDASSGSKAGMPKMEDSFKSADTNRDNYLSAQEFASGHAGSATGTGTSKSNSPGTSGNSSSTTPGSTDKSGTSSGTTPRY